LVWTVEWDERAVRELNNLDPPVQKTLVEYMGQHIMTEADPRRLGKALKHELQGLWRYRVGDYRLICNIQDQTITVLVLAIGRRPRFRGVV
jgi:mRNA interferase RelE/StbE